MQGYSKQRALCPGGGAGAAPLLDLGAASPPSPVPSNPGCPEEDGKDFARSHRLSNLEISI
jgi:hypothetical protein